MIAAPSVPRGPRLVLLRYLSGALLGRTFIACAALLGLMEVLALLEQMTPILQRHLGLYGVLTYMVLHTPLMMQTALPLSLLIGGLTLLTAMTVSSEMTILRSAGLSALGLMLYLLPATFMLGVISTVVEDQVTPRAELELAGWWNQTDPEPEKGHSFWVHSESWVAHIGYITGRGRQVHDIDFYEQGPDGLLRRARHADMAVSGPGYWLARNVKSWTVPEQGNIPAPVPEAEEKIPSDLSARQVLRLSLDNAPLSISTMRRGLKGRESIGQSPAWVRSAILERLFRPFAFIVMLLLALPVVYIPPRVGFRSWLPVWCLGAGLLFIITQGVFRAMGNAALLPAPVATVPGLIIFTLAAGAVLLRNEDK
ncbi:LptF/LptG family permease [Acetobacter sp. AN02]|uniref:LptF/LptG family permease n=1 Tax=Acetobacter sp. AN02 TaxID=2894186 RepID=UPI0024346823|nr:LptF/LptG family permease [Acetobacter sp. AN02]MDG6094253.1 LptF/LptG family permease [Acetobacter sp. AN02]